MMKREREHVIRLHGPWRVDGAINAETRIVPFPIQGTRSHRCTLCRAFGRPTGLTESTRVVLKISAAEFAERVELNGTILNPSEPNEVTPVLRERNEVRICIRVSDGSAVEFHGAELIIQEPSAGE